MVGILVALVTTTGLVTALSITSQQTALAAGKPDITGGCGKGGCGGTFKEIFPGCGKTGCAGTVDSGGAGLGDRHCGFGGGSC